ncbi:hypothetical protein D3C73_858290 [compost metagenome]
MFHAISNIVFFRIGGVSNDGFYNHSGFFTFFNQRLQFFPVTLFPCRNRRGCNDSFFTHSYMRLVPEKGGICTFVAHLGIGIGRGLELFHVVSNRFFQQIQRFAYLGQSRETSILLNDRNELLAIFNFIL